MADGTFSGVALLQGSAQPDTTIRAVNQSTGEVFETTSASDGTYEITVTDASSEYLILAVYDGSDGLYPAKPQAFVMPGDPIPPAEQDLLAWYDFSAEDGAMPVTDQSGNGYDIVNGSYGGVSTTINGIQAGDFTGDSYSISTDSISQVDLPVTVFIVAELADSASSYHAVYDHNDVEVATVSYEPELSGGVATRDGGGGGITGGSLSDTLISHRRSGSDSILRTMGTQVGTGNQVEPLDIIRLGSRNGDQNFFEGSIGEVLVYPSDKSGIFTEVEDYMAGKWEISI